MALVEGLQFTYALHPLAPGRFGFHRWRWELWHGARLHAAGWRLSRIDAERALHTYAASSARALFGLRPLAAPALSEQARIPPGASVRIDASGALCTLSPRHLDAIATPA